MITEAHKKQINDLVQKHGPYRIGSEVAHILIDFLLNDFENRNVYLNAVKSLIEEELLTKDQLNFKLYFEGNDFDEITLLDSSSIESVFEKVIKQLQNNTRHFNSASRNYAPDPSYEGGTYARQSARLSYEGRRSAQQLFRLRPRAPSCE